MVIFLLFWAILGIIFSLMSYIYDKKKINKDSKKTFFIILFFLISWIVALLYWVGPFFITIGSYKLTQ